MEKSRKINDRFSKNIERGNSKMMWSYQWKRSKMTIEMERVFSWFSKEKKKNSKNVVTYDQRWMHSSFLLKFKFFGFGRKKKERKEAFVDEISNKTQIFFFLLLFHYWSENLNLKQWKNICIWFIFKKEFNAMFLISFLF